ncbi:hypothetical protein CNMCM8980_005858 [Aspergillus fumigatiaffinis]|uniref:Transcription factor Iwr1 domain-containing protein n=1 Tax=Aspergillus fumigatiaffinis TaxID=340414 RepID=A0A8H4M749_9EURO|nr:hypothetical protein CNMCM5878_007574 [Aspergillus fumigatiaffinis]KAF4231194.1 hypothetical protein CNMCM6457_005595 [Aspergillus fumigatiaffinis]KAF4244467.1 hypothetical protein CNMCM6805_008719 [Aspergillus fumigatiaffinis]KAF4248494.1 hypothetical protein CNMCM8980_005858 [Aspergillus fumigatiaffinis]
MALPPEQINIKRRREEEPVDTLYIQSELHQTKRRFTDFVFQRVQVSGNARDSGSSSPASLAAPSRTLLTPRSVSSSAFPVSRGATRPSGPGADVGATVPLVRATSPGAEFREEQRLAAVRKAAEEKLHRALHSSSGVAGADLVGSPAVDGARESSASSGRESPVSASPRSVRRFQISRSNTPVNVLRSAGGGVQKRRGDGAVAVLVEKLRRTPHSRQASLVADAAAQAATAEGEVRGVSVPEPEPEPARPRKRPVVNQAERKWREERKTAISAAKEHITQVLEKEAHARKSNWEYESERLAREFEQIALELEGGMETEPSVQQPVAQTTARPVIPKPPLKYQPRTPNRPRGTTPRETSVPAVPDVRPPVEAMVQEEDDSDGEYVYDTYIRRPLPEGTLLTNPLTDLETVHEKWFQQNGIDTTRQDIGVIVITQEDEEYWEHFAEDDEDEEWDSEDADSNAENNPANDYPDEDLSWDDEEDDPTAIYHKYRTHGASDDEEFDSVDSANEGRRAGRVGVGVGFGFGLDSHVDSDEDSLDGDGPNHDRMRRW